jgi:hypothetical protein
VCDLMAAVLVADDDGLAVQWILALLHYFPGCSRVRDDTCITIMPKHLYGMLQV